MIPLLLLAIVLSAAVATYEFSPKAHVWTDDHLLAFRAALAAHHAADAHLAAAKAAPHPAVAVQHAHAAAAANQAAAAKTADAAKAAKTEPQRAATVESATAVVVREDEITNTLADAHLSAAEAEPDPTVAVQHAHDAAVANQAAAQKAIEAAEAARTEQQRAAAAQKAAKAADRENRIAAAFAKLGVGQCDVQTYTKVTPQVRDVLLAKLHGKGMTVTGDNPWDIDTHDHNVKLRAVWDQRTQTLKLIVTAGASGILSGEPAFVVCPAVWAKIDPVMKEILGA